VNVNSVGRLVNLINERYNLAPGHEFD